MNTPQKGMHTTYDVRTRARTCTEGTHSPRQDGALLSAEPYALLNAHVAAADVARGVAATGGGGYNADVVDGPCEHEAD